MQKKYLSFLGVGVVAIAALANNNAESLPTVVVQGKKYYVYEAKKNQTFFNIANDFNWNLEELMNINPNIMSPMTKGTKIFYPANQPETEYPSTSNTSLDTVCANVNASLIEDGFRELFHNVKKGESVYSISRIYSITPDSLYSLNPNSRYGIKAGETLKIRKAIGKSEGKNPEFYIIREGDTLYQLARKFNTNVASILSLNPGISESNFKAGSAIRVPSYGEGVKMEMQNKEEKVIAGFSNYVVGKDETWDSVAQRTGVSVEELKSINNVSSLKPNTILGIPELRLDTISSPQVIIDPREESQAGLNEIYSEVHRLPIAIDSVGHIRIGLVLSEPTSKKDIDFARGFLTGLNKLKRQNYKVTFRVFDGRGDEDILIDSLGNYGAQVLFTTYDKKTPDFFADYAMVNQTPVINTFDMKDEHYMVNPYFVNLLTPSSYFNDEISNYLRGIHSDSKLILIGGDGDDALCAALKEKWLSNNIISLVSADQLSTFEFENGIQYIIFGNVTKKDEIISLVDIVGTIKANNPENKISFIGRPNWIVYDESLREKFQNADLMIPSRFYYDKNSVEAKDFLTEYKALFKVTPAKSFPMYSTMGYDEALFFIPALATNGGDINKIYSSTQGVQSEFELQRASNWSGIINPVVYLVRFNPDGRIEKQKIK